MPRTPGAKDGDAVQREYHKRNDDYWERPTLADLIQSQLSSGPVSYDELRDIAADLGYALTSFYQTMSNLRIDGLIAQGDGIVSAADDLLGL